MIYQPIDDNVQGRIPVIGPSPMTWEEVANLGYEPQACLDKLMALMLEAVMVPVWRLEYRTTTTLATYVFGYPPEEPLR